MHEQAPCIFCGATSTWGVCCTAEQVRRDFAEELRLGEDRNRALLVAGRSLASVLERWHLELRGPEREIVVVAREILGLVGDARDTRHQIVMHQTGDH